MQISKLPLESVFTTGEQMKRLTITYFHDLDVFRKFSLPQFFNFVKNLPYIPDPPDMEHISRPAAALSENAKYRDCDEKSILIAAFLTLQKMGKAWRFVAVSTHKSKKLHHVLVDWNMGGQMIYLDATYPKNKLFMFKRFTNIVPICDWVGVNV